MSLLMTVHNPVYRNYVFWTGVLILKMLAMSLLTGCKRFHSRVYANPEDVHFHRVQVTFHNEAIERVRRAHRNDMESIVPLIIIGYFYIQTNPPQEWAMQLYTYSAIFRLLHTLVYAVWVVPQPARAIAFFVPFLATAFMAVKTTLHFSKAAG